MHGQLMPWRMLCGGDLSGVSFLAWPIVNLEQGRVLLAVFAALGTHEGK